jgi:hypothetical protein
VVAAITATELVPYVPIFHNKVGGRITSNFGGSVALGARRFGINFASTPMQTFTNDGLIYISNQTTIWIGGSTTTIRGRITMNDGAYLRPLGLFSPPCFSAQYIFNSTILFSGC